MPRNRGRNTTLIASMSLAGIEQAMAFEGTTDKEVFEAYVRRFLVPALRPGQVVVLDNLGAHKGERVRNLVEARGASLLFLPAYSPDFSPIEESLSKCQAADCASKVVPSRSIAQRTLTLRRASAIRAWVCLLPSALLRS